MAPNNNQIYEANDDDFEFDSFGQVIKCVEDEEDDYPEEEEVDQVMRDQLPSKPVRVARPQQAAVRTIARAEGALPPEAFYDEFALLNCWQSAVLDYKHHHPEFFGPPTSAPRKLSEKHQKAPLWYGTMPSPSSNIPTDSSAASTSTSASTKSKSKSGKRKRSNSLQTQQQPSQSTSQPSKKMKKHYPLPTLRAGSPTWTPKSPTFQRSPSLPLSTLSSLPSLETLTQDSTPPIPPTTVQFRNINGGNWSSGRVFTSSSGAIPPLLSPPPSSSITSPSTSVSVSTSDPSTSTSVTSVISSSNGPLRKSFPLPPPMTPLSPTSDSGAGGGESEEELLQNALWSWFNAGYQTGLYHASVGMAGFKGGNGEGGQGE